MTNFELIYGIKTRAGIASSFLTYISNSPVGLGPKPGEPLAWGLPVSDTEARSNHEVGSKSTKRV